MNRLLSANLICLRKHKFFWIGMSFMFAAGIFFPVNRYLDMKQCGSVNNLDNGFFGCALFIGILTAVFCSLYTGTEYSDGTMRNKIVIGHKRRDIYLANFITSAVTGIAMCAVFFLPYLCIGIPLLGFFELDISRILLFALTVFVLAVAFTAVFTMIAMLNHNKTVSAVVCILLAFGLLLTGAFLSAQLQAPKVFEIPSVDEDNLPIMKEVPNPAYCKGTERIITQTLLDVFPGGQALQCASLEAEKLPRLPFYSLAVILSSTGIGLYFFEKKDLK